MTVSVVIPTLHACDHLLDPLTENIRSYGRTGVLDQLIVEDAGGTFAEQSNRAAAKCSGDILLFLNDDMVAPDTDWLTPLLAPFASPEVGIVGGRLTNPQGDVVHAGIRLTVELGWNAHNITQDWAGGDVHAVTGACLAVRRGLFQDLRGFYMGYMNGAEDVDLCLRAWAAGSQVVYTPLCTLIHHESQTPGRWDHVAANVALFRSRFDFTVGVHWLGDDSGTPRDGSRS